MASERDETREQFEKRLLRYNDADLVAQIMAYIDCEEEHPNEPITWDDARRERFTDQLRQIAAESGEDSE